MNYGHWVPISKALTSSLPHNETRPYSELEAMFSLQVDFDTNKMVTLRGYASLWRWTTGKVTRFLTKAGVKIHYAQDTSKRQNQRGKIKVLTRDDHETSPEQIRNDYGTIRFIDNRCLQAEKKR